MPPIYTIQVNDERVYYQMRLVDYRSPAQLERNRQNGRLDGPLMLIIPGHGQTINGPYHLTNTAAHLSPAQIAWCIDPIPTIGGDPLEAQAISHIFHHHAPQLFPDLHQPPTATLIGWSHGGSEAIRAATYDPQTFPQCIALCTTGLTTRPPLVVMVAFLLEATRILGLALRQTDWTTFALTLRLGYNASLGAFHDLYHSRSIRRLWEDICWAAQTIPLPNTYSGQLVIQFAQDDSLIRWQDSFPHATPTTLHQHAAAYQQTHFPHTNQLFLQCLPGAHVNPERHPTLCLQTALASLGQYRHPPNHDH
ncbi:MAG TPA: hypothetical protein VLL52_13845 [Anaerolineae bacterium]|nr:hypothetical protein [Anaerolineae bacterium]